MKNTAQDIKLTAIERIQNGEDFMTIYKEEVSEILKTEKENVFFDTDREFYYTTNYMEQIIKAKQEKVLLALPRLTLEFEFNVKKIYSFNELFRDQTMTVHNRNHYEYKEELGNEFKRLNKNGMLEMILKNKYLMLQVEFEVSHTARDLDNVMKPFIDNLFCNISNDDNAIKKLTQVLREGSIYKNSESNDEHIYLRVIVLNEDDISFGSIKKSIKDKEKHLTNMKDIIN